LTSRLLKFGFEHPRSGRLAVNEAGEDMRPEQYSDLSREACQAAGVPVCTLHAARHSSVTLMRPVVGRDNLVRHTQLDMTSQRCAPPTRTRTKRTW
jgi:hypothetical protein